MTVHGVEIHWFADKEKIPSAVVSKEGHAGNVLEHERMHYYWFSWKGCHSKQCFKMPNP